MPGRTRTSTPAKDDSGSTPRLVDGVEVVKDEAELSHLSNRPGAAPIYLRTRRVLTLADGTQTHACADCPDVTGSRGDIIKHRVSRHGAPKGGARPKDRDAVPPANALRMTVGEVLGLAESVDQWETVTTALEARVVEAEARAHAAETRLRRIDRALDRAGFTLKVEEED